jgi:UDP-2,4-diacetamido-2,4,6-trideoxy-beta-L-altropyranose hydrolase
MKNLAIFRFEASPTIGAGHAIRSCVLADALVEEGWICKVVTTLTTYDFIPKMDRFERIDSENFYSNPVTCDLLVIDNYELDQSYEKHFRLTAKKIFVIDDLANRIHECDILLDQTYGRDGEDYRNLVPKHCKILAGSDYVLLRKEFTELRPKALEKRRQTTEVKRILISMGGSDPHNYTLKALDMVKQSGFSGAIDIVIGFTSVNTESVKKYISNLPNECTIHVNADMPELIYEADLAIGAAGSGVWERCCLGLPQCLIKTADNQEKIHKQLLIFGGLSHLAEAYIGNYSDLSKWASKITDGFGINDIIKAIIDHDLDKNISLKKVFESDKDIIFKWQNIEEIRKYFNAPYSPTYLEHTDWFIQRLKQLENPFWIILNGNSKIGSISLTYNNAENYYDLSWYVIPDKWGKGIGTSALKLALQKIRPFKVHAFVKKENLASHRSLQKLGFQVVDENNYILDTNFINRL